MKFEPGCYYRTSTGQTAMVGAVLPSGFSCVDGEIVGWVQQQDGCWEVSGWYRDGTEAMVGGDLLEKIATERVWISKNLVTGKIHFWNSPPLLGGDHRVWHQEVEVHDDQDS